MLPCNYSRIQALLCILLPATLLQAAVTPRGMLTLSSTFENISVVVPLNGATAADMRSVDSTRVEYRLTGDTDWRRGHPLSVIANIPMNDTFGLFADTLEDLFDARGVAPDYRLAGSVFSLNENASYDIRVTIYAGGSALSPLSGTVSTVAHHFPAAGRDLYVDVRNGDNAHSGNSVSDAKKTLAAVAGLGLQPGDKIHIAQGTYYEMLDLTGLSGNAGNYIQFLASGDSVIIDGADETIAAGASWTLYQNDIAGNPVYSTPVGWVPHSVFAAAPGDVNLDGAFYEYHGANIPGGGNTLADLVNNVMRLNAFGSFYADSAAGRVYIVMGANNPANTALRVGKREACINLTECGYLLFRGIRVTHGNLIGLNLKGCSNIVVNSCRFVDVERPVFTPVYRDSMPTEACVVESSSFAFPKADVWMRNGQGAWTQMHGDTSYGGGNDVGQNNTMGIEAALAGSGWVVRANSFDTLYDGIRFSMLAPYPDQYFSPQFYANMDICHNRFSHIIDDALEPEGAAVNMRIYRNVLTRVGMGLSDCPTTIGPLYFFRNEVSHWSYYQGGGNGIKAKPLGSTLHDFGAAFHYHNTFYQISPDNAQYCNDYSDYFDTYKNNIFVGGSEVFRMTNMRMFNTPMKIVLDYNSYYTLAPTGNFVRITGTSCQDSACVRTLGFEANGIFLHGAPPDVVSGTIQPPDLNLLASAREIDRGLFIPGINDGFAGVAPDMGAFEFGALPSTEAAVAARILPGIHASPNPFGPGSGLKISVTSLRGGSPELFIYDTRGRLVSKLASQGRRDRTDRYAWNGKTASGGPLVSGVYFAVAQVDGKRLTQKVSFLR